MELRADPRGPLRIWERPRAEASYVIGADTGGGQKAGDYSAAVVWELDRPVLVATFQAQLEAHEFAQALMAIGTYYGGRDGLAYLVPEVNNHGMATLNQLKMIGYWNLYCRVVWDKVDKVWKPVVGWQTSMKSRPILIDRVRVALSDPKTVIPDTVFLDEAATFVVTNSGKEEHQPGCYDDVLLAGAMGLEGRATKWAEEPDKIKQDVAHDAPVTAEEVADHQRRFLMDSIAAVEDDMESSREVLYVEEGW